jgi:IS30 family transposase
MLVCHPSKSLVDAFKGKEPTILGNSRKILYKSLLMHVRLPEVEQRSVPIRREEDTVVSSHGQRKGCVATFLERKSRFYYAYLMPD